MPGRISVGISAWADKSLVQSGWYPKRASTAEARLRYYASQFSIVENDSMYYAVPPPEQAELWVARTPRGFTMNVKAFASLTGHYTDPKRLPRDLREALPAAIRSKRNVYPDDLGDEVRAELAARFRAAIEPLRATGRLGVVLFQFPVWFTPSPENRRTVMAIGEMVPGCRAAVELRNHTWMTDHDRERTWRELREAGLVYTCVDEPQGLPSSIPPLAVATSDFALVRFHGRDASRWSRTTQTAAERFRYRYSIDELKEWVPKLRRLAKEASTVHAVMNNCHSDDAVTNARQLADALGTTVTDSRIAAI